MKPSLYIVFGLSTFFSILACATLAGSLYGISTTTEGYVLIAIASVLACSGMIIREISDLRQELAKNN